MGLLPSIRGFAAVSHNPAGDVRHPLHHPCRHALRRCARHDRRLALALDCGGHFRHDQPQHCPRAQLRTRVHRSSGRRCGCLNRLAPLEHFAPPNHTATPLACAAIHLLQLPRRAYLAPAAHHLCRHPPRHAPYAGRVCWSRRARETSLAGRRSLATCRRRPRCPRNGRRHRPHRPGGAADARGYASGGGRRGWQERAPQAFEPAVKRAWWTAAPVPCVCSPAQRLTSTDSAVVHESSLSHSTPSIKQL
mmetsp:Transcript_62869/g.124152  ORF Transcript_62869/g.124152 Transcript_62869/m.124152 type:complete len:249 (+) Transcript_62869:339-1085(+)